MFRRFTIAAVAAATALALTPQAGLAEDDTVFTPGSDGIGDTYYPLDGNGGYDAKHYLLDLAYDENTDVLSGIATTTAEATQNLSSLNLDFNGMTVREVKVNGRRAPFQRIGGELTVKPQQGLRRGSTFTVAVRYDGVPQSLGNFRGFNATADGGVFMGIEPRSGAFLFPGNQHPRDKAAYTFKITVRDGLEAVANGKLVGSHTEYGRTTWVWNAAEPQRPEATALSIGDFRLDTFQRNGITHTNAIDESMSDKLFRPRTGERFALSQRADSAFKRLARTITVPPGGAEVSFDTIYQIEGGFDYLFVEAHTVGQDDWTTLPDLNGHTDRGTGFCVSGPLVLHPHLTHYMTSQSPARCAPTGSTGEWHAASNGVDAYQRWRVDLSAFAGRQVEMSISYRTNQGTENSGVFVDDIVVSTGEGTTSFEDDGDIFDGWTVPGAPPGSPGNRTDWIVGTVDQAPGPEGPVADHHVATQPAVIDFLSEKLGPYPFADAGTIIDNFSAPVFTEDHRYLAGTSASQSRATFDRFTVNPDSQYQARVVSETAAQWFGASVSIKNWRDIWLTEGLIAYAFALAREHEGLFTVQQLVDAVFDSHPADDRVWTFNLLDPGPQNQFHLGIFERGLISTHVLRLAIGDEAFFRVLRTYLADNKHGNASSEDFFALAERISGQDLDRLINVWWEQPRKPDVRPGPTGQHAAGPLTTEGKSVPH